MYEGDQKARIQAYRKRERERGKKKEKLMRKEKRAASHR